MIKSGALKKIVIVAAVLGAIAAFRIFGLDEYLALSYIKGSQESFASLYAEHSVLVIAVYMAVYIAVTSLSLPGAAVMTLAGGGLFGLVAGTIIVSFASTIGATIACLVSRYLLRDWVQSRFADRIRKVNDELEREGPFYLFTLRLIPIFPFWMINLVIGVTKIPVITFYWVSQVGMLPGTIVYVNAGKELAKIDSLSGIVSPGLILSFVILGLFPITVKKMISFYRSRKDLAAHGETHRSKP